MVTAHTLSEPQLFRAYWDDGLLDLSAGAALLLIGIGWQTELGPLAVLQAPLWVVLWGPLRRRIVEPRAGFVQFSLERRRRTKRGLRWTLAAGVGMLALLLFTAVRFGRGDAGLAPSALAPGLPGLLVAIPAGIAGVLTGARRFHAYGLALVATAALTVILDRGPELPFLVTGPLLLATGVVLMTRFLRDSRAYADGPR